MNTAEILDKSLIWLYYNQRNTSLNSYEISSVLNSLENSFQNKTSALEISAGGELRGCYRYANTDSLSAANSFKDVKQVVPEELYILTQIILNTLNTEPDKFHDMFEIPGLECEEWDQLAKVAHYLNKQGLIGSETIKNRLLIKLTIEGKIYLENSNT